MKSAYINALTIKERKDLASCLCCYSSNYDKTFGETRDVYEILFKSNNSGGYGISVCKSCLIDLKSKLDAILLLTEELPC